MNGRDILIFLSFKYEGDWEQIYKAIKQREVIDDAEMTKVLMENKASVITIIDEDYPEYVKNIYHPPFCLFYYGDRSLLDEHRARLGVVGSRDNSQYGALMTSKIVGELAKDYIIVSGLAKGIDTIAHEAAIKAGGKTIAILGSGIDRCYPASNKSLYESVKKDHLLLSEYPMSIAPKDTNFPQRNRLISAFSHGLFVAEANKKSGTLITVASTLSLGRDVFCLPYEADKDSACNILIRDGAYLVEKASDIKDILKPICS